MNIERQNTPIALIDNLQFMLTFTFRNSEYQFVDREKAELLIKRTLMEEGLNYTTIHQNSLINFSIIKEMQKGTTISVLIWYNPLRKLRHDLQEMNNIRFERGLRSRESNFVPPEDINQEEQIRNVGYAVNCINAILSAAFEAQKIIKISFNISRLPTIKLSVLKIEGTIDTRFQEENINEMHQKLSHTYFKHIQDLPLYRSEKVEVEMVDFMSISGCVSIVINKHFIEDGKIQYQKVGTVYLKTPTIMRFEYAKNLHDKKYRKKRKNTITDRSLKRYTVDAPTTSTLKTDLEKIQQYFFNHLTETQQHYTDSFSNADSYKIPDEFIVGNKLIDNESGDF